MIMNTIHVCIMRLSNMYAPSDLYPKSFLLINAGIKKEKKREAEAERRRVSE